MTEVADSTVGMSSYHLMTEVGRPLSPSEIRFLAARHGHLYPLEQVERALDKMVARGWVREVGDRYDLVDPSRRRVLARRQIDDAPDPGWEGWRLADGTPQGVPIETVVS